MGNFNQDLRSVIQTRLLSPVRVCVCVCHLFFGSLESVFIIFDRSQTCNLFLLLTPLKWTIGNGNRNGTNKVELLLPSYFLSISQYCKKIDS